MSRLILASSSRYRARELSRLVSGFDTASPDIDETPRHGEAAEALALRLAVDKARAIARGQAGATVIGGDQVAALDDRLVGKPGSAEAARAQLRAASGRRVRFLTGLCVMPATAGAPLTHLDVTTVHFRSLDEDEIRRYVEAEQPLDCAGSFKCEGLGISLFERIETSDPTALIGLPLIALARMLRRCGYALP